MDKVKLIPLDKHGGRNPNFDPSQYAYVEGRPLGPWIEIATGKEVNVSPYAVPLGMEKMPLPGADGNYRAAWDAYRLELQKEKYARHPTLDPEKNGGVVCNDIDYLDI